MTSWDVKRRMWQRKPKLLRAEQHTHTHNLTTHRGRCELRGYSQSREGTSAASAAVVIWADLRSFIKTQFMLCCPKQLSSFIGAFYNVCGWKTISGSAHGVWSFLILVFLCSRLLNNDCLWLHWWAASAFPESLVKYFNQHLCLFPMFTFQCRHIFVKHNW